jgi:hypothetical protein
MFDIMERDPNDNSNERMDDRPSSDDTPFDTDARRVAVEDVTPEVEPGPAITDV